MKKLSFEEVVYRTSPRSSYNTIGILPMLITFFSSLLIIMVLLLLPACSSIPLVKPLPPCDPSRFDMHTLRGRLSHAICEVKQNAKKI